MMLPRLVLVGAVLLAPCSVTAQMVVQPEPKLEHPQLTVRDALYALRDSLTLVEAASARLARDLSTSSDQALSSRSRVISDRCQAALAQLRLSRDTVTTYALPQPDARKVRPALESVIRQLEVDLGNCVQEFSALSAPEKAVELRGYGIGRGQRVQQAIRPLVPVLQRYFSEGLGTAYRPSVRGAGSIPSGNPGR